MQMFVIIFPHELAIVTWLDKSSPAFDEIKLVSIPATEHHLS